LEGNWTIDTSCVDVLNSIWALLLVPDLEDPAYGALQFDTNVRNMLVTQKFYSEPAALDSIIKTHLAKHASKTRRQWAEELGC